MTFIKISYEERSVKEQLSEVRAMFRDETCWIKRSWAKTNRESTDPLPWGHPEARCWCLGGAINTVEPIFRVPLYAAVELFIPSRFGTIFAFNDSPTTTFPDVISVLNQAIRYEEYKPQW